MNPNIQTRLSNFSETPPASAWQRIADALDSPAFAQKLHDFETAPPAHAWEAIQQKIDTNTKVVPLRSKLFQYAIAASVLVAIVAGGIVYLNHRTEPDLVRRSQNDAPNTATTNTLLDTQIRQTEEDETARNNSAALQANADLRNSTVTPAMVHYAPRVQLPHKALLTSQITVAPEEKTSIDTSLQSRYMIATTASGNVVRLPKKAYSDYVCADRFQSYQCKERLAAIQSKLAASVATDFTDFMDLLKTLQEPQ